MPFRKIKLYGKLGKLFGKEWNLDVNSVGEAIRAINANTNGRLEEYLYNGKGAKVYYKVCIKNKNNTISKEEINTPYEKGDIYIIPVIRGNEKNGVFQTILGVVLVVVGLVINYITFGSGSPVGSLFIKAGVALALGGIAQMLSPNPNTNDVERKTSYLFQGNATTVNQGMAVGTIYGRALVNPMPISISADNIDQNSYEGEIINIGAVGLINETLILYSYKGGTATLIGFDEFKDVSTPPKRYLIKTYSGSYTNWSTYDYTCSSKSQGDTWTQGGSNSYDSLGNYTNTSWYTKNGINQGGLSGFGLCRTSEGFAYCFITSGTQIHWESLGAFDVNGSCCTTNGTIFYTETGGVYVDLLNEDTELNAINRLLNSISWSAWQSTPIYPHYQQRVSGFSFDYRIVRTKSITLPGKYNPSFQYKYSAIIQRRIYGSSDPWVDAETISTTVSPQPDGTLILPELEIPNESGYESKITSPSINYA